jgi:hypothetical protein
MGAIHFSIDLRLAELFKRNLGIDNFVETGTFEGNTIELVRPVFGKIHSVELSPHYFTKAQDRFREVPAVHLAQGPSPAFLSSHREEFVAEPILFWLDAHWCAADQTGGENAQSPLLEELNAIGELHPSSVVLIDDARLYLCPPSRPHRSADWPDFHDVTQRLLRLSANHRLMVLNDVILFYPESARAPLKEFAFEHGVDWLALAHMAEAQERRIARKAGRKKLLTFWRS